jgi:hypothetical protein
MKPIVMFAIGICVVAVTAATSTAVVIGPSQGPDWQAIAQVKLGWVFGDPKNPQNTDPLAGWDLYVGGTLPRWDYDAARHFGSDPAEWYIRLPNVIDLLPRKYFWLSYVYERDNTYAGPRAFTNIDWYPATGFENFGLREEWFDASGNPTSESYSGVFARINLTVDLLPNPDYEDLWIGTTGDGASPGGDGWDLVEVYVMTVSIPEPGTILLCILAGLVPLCWRPKVRV